MDVDFVKHLKLNQLRLVAAVAEHGQLGRAAAALSITQPAASRMLADIEHRVGAPICTRHAKGMVLTEVGMAIARRAHNSLSELNALSREVEYLKQGGMGTIRIGAVTGAAVGYVIPAVNALKREVAETEIDIDVDTSDVLVESLMAGQADFVLARVPRNHDFSEFDIYPGRTETVRLVVRADHPLLVHDRVSLRDLAPYDWVMQSHRAPIREAVEAAILEVGAELPRGVVNTTSLLAIMGLLVSSEAIAPMASEVSDLLTSRPVNARLVALPIETEIVMTPYYLLQMKGRQLPPLADRLRTLILEELKR